MEFKQLGEENVLEFCSLIKDMYAHLEDLEWFSPMPYDLEGVRQIVASPRFFILGAFEGGQLCAVSSFDFKCGKLIGQSFMPPYCTLENTAEIGFTMVKSGFKGRGIMKMLIEQLEKQALRFNKRYLFGKVHICNLASYKSFIACGFAEFSRYQKSVERADFEQFLSAGLLSKGAMGKAQESLARNENDIEATYTILTKKL